MDIEDDTLYSGTNTSNLLVSKPHPSLNNFSYRVLIGKCATPVSSIPVTLNVNTMPFISQHPEDITICEGIGTSFTLTAFGEPLEYNWQYRVGNNVQNIQFNAGLSGANTNTLSIDGANLLNYNTYQFRSIVHSGACIDTSNFASLNVKRLIPAPVFTMWGNSDPMFYFLSNILIGDSAFVSYGDGQTDTIFIGDYREFTHTYTANGRYDVCIDIFGSCDTVKYCIQLDVFGIEEVEVAKTNISQQVKIYPIPNNGLFEISNNLEIPINVSIENLLGQKVLQFIINANSHQYVNSKLGRGTYYVRYTDNKEQSGFSKMIVQ
jgi:hypothetical protein